MNLQILSAGLGTRLRPITDKIPKPALPVLNVPMFFWSYHYFADHFSQRENFKNIVVNTFHLEETLQRLVRRYDKQIQFVSDGKEILGTGGGIQNAKRYLTGSGNFWVANGDSVFISDDDFVKKAEAIHKESKAICTLIVIDHKEVGKKFGGVWVDEHDKVLDIGKAKPNKAVHGYHFTGFRLLSDEIFNYLPKGPSELFDALRMAMKDGHKVSILKTDGEFFETGNVEDFINTTGVLLDYLKEQKYPKYLGSLLKKYSPHSKLNEVSTDLKMQDHPDLKSLFVDEGFKLFHDTTLEGFVVAGPDVEVKERSFLKNVVVLGNQTIPENSEYQNTIIY